MNKPAYPYPKAQQPQQIITKKTELMRRSISEYSYSNDKLDGMFNFDMKGRNPDNVFVRLDIKSGYYDDKSYEIVIEEIIQQDNLNYDKDVLAYAEVMKQNKKDVANYHLAMKEYMDWEIAQEQKKEKKK